MKSQARVVVIGGGIVGCSVAYHLTKMGWTDVVVVDQGPLFHNRGSTSHAPGLIFQHNNSKAVCQLARWSVETYLEAEQAANIGRTVFQTGSLEIAHTPERWAELKRKLGNAHAWGLEAHLIGPDDVKARVPIMRTDDLLGAFYVPTDADVRGVRVMESLARQAESRGAVFYPNTPVTGIEVKDGRARSVATAQGTISTDIVVCAAGLWGPVIGRMVGLQLPMTPCQHIYVKTKPLAELAGETDEVRHPIVRYQDKDLYFRQHGEGYGFGSYRHDPLIVFADDLPRHDHPAIFPYTPEHAAASWADAVHRIPCLAHAEVENAFNGLFSFTPDGNTILGEAPEVRGFWAADAVWVTHGGGTGRALANMLVHGDPGLDLRELDINRFHPHTASKSYIKARAERQYIEVYDITHPNQQMENPRGLRTSPFHARQKDLGAVFVESAGWEKPQWYGANEQLAEPDAAAWPGRTGWAAQYWSPIIGREHAATRKRVGLFDLTSFYKLEVTGPGALAFLQGLCANQLDRPVGSVTYTSMLTARGGIKCDLTVTRLGTNRFWVVTGGGTGPMDTAWLRHHAPSDGSVHIQNVTSSHGALGVWGPKARDLVQSVSENDFSNAAFPYLTAQHVFINHLPVMAVRISYAGELGWELYSATEYGLCLWDTLWAAGRAHGIAAVGGGAFDSLRLEKGYRLWGVDIHTDYNPYEAGISFAVRLNKGDFLGRDALVQAKTQGITRKLCALVFDDPRVAIMGKEPIFDGESVLGHVTSANYGYSVRQSIAYGYLPVSHAKEGTKVEVYFFGNRYAARVMPEPLYDPRNEKLKA